MNHPRDRHGADTAAALSGSWRPHPPPPRLSEEQLERITPLLMATGGAGLLWWAIRDSPLREAPPAREIRDAYRLQTIDARLHERRLERALDVLAGVGVVPIIAKGWAVARRYPRVGLRPFGDLDLFVDPLRYDAAAGALRAYPWETFRVDLHRGVPELGRGWAEILAFSDEAAVGGRPLRLLGPEDELSLLALHLLRHGAWRPLWLCDVAQILEGTGHFDSDHIDSLGRRRADQVRIVVGLARAVLGADEHPTLWPDASAELPGWVAPTLLRSWGEGGHYTLTTRIALARPSLKAMSESVRVRWPNAIEATVRWHAPFNRMPRFPLQFLDAFVRAARAVVGSPPVIARRLIRRTPR